MNLTISGYRFPKLILSGFPFFPVLCPSVDYEGEFMKVNAECYDFKSSPLAG